MADFVGRKIAVGIAKESSRGTVEGSVGYWTPHLSLDFEDKNEKMLNESALGVIEKNNDSEIVKEWAEGSIEGKVTDEAIGLLLLAAFGSVNTVANGDASGNVYDHTFSVAQSNVANSFSLYKKDDINDLGFSLGVLKNLELTVEVGEYVKVKTDWLTKKGVAGSRTVAYSDEKEFVARHAAFKVAANEAGLSGASAVGISSFTISLTRNAEARFETGDNEPAEIHNGAWECEISVTKRYTDDTFRDYWQNNTKFALELSLTNTDETIGTAENPTITFTLPRVVVSDWDSGKGLDDISEEDMTITGLYSTTDSKMIEALVTNLATSY